MRFMRGTVQWWNCCGDSHEADGVSVAMIGMSVEPDGPLFIARRCQHNTHCDNAR